MSFDRVSPGDVIDGKYQVERILGAGGMGVVVAAHHLDLGERVAIKFMLREALAEPGHAERFVREARAAVKLKSVHTARVLDVGRLADGEPFMVMEHLHGRDLDAELAARGPLPPRIAVDWILQASEALAEAHGIGMVHRDVKLKNLFLTHTVDGEPFVKVLDFGLAKLVGARDEISLTASNAIFGSPQYMSPEQMRSAKDADFRSDVWSIGVCLYELLVGRTPFEADTLAELCAMVLKDPVPLPSSFAPVPADLEAVVMRCLAKDPAYRYQSISELAYALQHYGDDASVRRILRVQRGAARVHAVTVEAIPPADPSSRRTLSAWDSGTPPGTPTPFRPWTGYVHKVVAGVGMGLLLVAALGAVAVLVHRNAPPVASAAVVPTFVPMDMPPPAETAVTPPPPPPPSETPAAIPAPANGEAEGAATHPPKRKARPAGVRTAPSGAASGRVFPRKNTPGTGTEYM